jgi:hypothetical protein
MLLFTRLNKCVQEMVKRTEETMKEDAFDDLRGEFNYKAELEKARGALNARIGRFASDRPGMGYRVLARKFKISLGAVCAIAKGYRLKRKPGPRAGYKMKRRSFPR